MKNLMQLLLHNRSFCLFWISQIIMALIGQAYIVTQSWLVLEVTGSTVLLGTLLMIGTLPRIILLPVTGIIADRFSPKLILIITEVALAIVTAVFSMTLFFHNINLWGMFSYAVIYGVISAIFLPSSYSIIPKIVDSQNLQKANSLIQLTNQTAVFVGAALIGIIISKAGLVSAYGSITIAVIVSFGLLFFIKNPLIKTKDTNKFDTEEHLPQTSYKDILHIPLLPFLILLSAVMNLGVIGPMQVGLSILAHNTPHLGAQALGYLTSSFGLGSMIGVLLGGLVQDKNKQFRAIIFGAITFGVFWSFVGFLNNFILLLSLLLITGACVGIVNILFITTLQTRTPLTLLGRVMSLQLMGSIGLQPISLLLSGWLVSLIGINELFLYGGAIIVAFCIIGTVIIKLITKPRRQQENGSKLNRDQAKSSSAQSSDE